MKGKTIMAKTKKELAQLVIKLWNNIDQADQAPDMDTLFQHLDKRYLLCLIEDFRDAVKQNVEYGQCELLLNDEDEINAMLEEARKVLGEKDEL